MIVKTMTDLIGNTPMLEIDPAITGLKNIELYAKLEMMNPFGSVKDRTAWGMIKDELEDLKKTNKTIYENSSGNTAKSLQAIAGIHGLKFKLVAALAKVDEQKDVLLVQGAQIEEIAAASDCFDPTDPNDPQFLIERTARANPGEVYFPSQFTNEKNPDFHESTTALEILDDLGTVDYFIGGLGTTGSSLGITRKLRENNPAFISIGVTSKPNHFIPGIRSVGQLWETGLFKKEIYDANIALSSMEAVEGMMTLNRQCGVLCGPSSGANYKAAIDYLKTIDDQLTERKKAVFIVCDRMEWYISYIRERMPHIFGEQNKENGIQNYDGLKAPPAKVIRAENFGQWQRENSNAVMIDIRSRDSFQVISMPQSINMPVEMFEKWIDNNNPFPANTPVLIICAIGERSRHYASYLSSLGCQAWNLEGGILSWHDTCRIAA